MEKTVAKFPQNILYDVKNRAQFRRWLELNHATESECWIFVKRGIPDENFWYVDAVEEALCFGWIDSVLKRVPDIGLLQRISPRKKHSQWSELNKERCRRLEKLGLMTEFGKAVLPDLSEESFVIDYDILTALKGDPQLWKNFQNFPPLYQRVRIDCIQRVKNDKTMYENRLRHFIEKSKKNVMFGEWNDRGRLLRY